MIGTEDSPFVLVGPFGRHCLNFRQGGDDEMGGTGSGIKGPQPGTFFDDDQFEEQPTSEISMDKGVGMDQMEDEGGQNQQNEQVPAFKISRNSPMTETLSILCWNMKNFTNNFRPGGWGIKQIKINYVVEVIKNIRPKIVFLLELGDDYKCVIEGYEKKNGDKIIGLDQKLITYKFEGVPADISGHEYYLVGYQTIPKFTPNIPSKDQADLSLDNGLLNNPVNAQSFKTKKGYLISYRKPLIVKIGSYPIYVMTIHAPAPDHSLDDRKAIMNSCFNVLKSLEEDDSLIICGDFNFNTEDLKAVQKEAQELGFQFTNFPATSMRKKATMLYKEFEGSGSQPFDQFFYRLSDSIQINSSLTRLVEPLENFVYENLDIPELLQRFKDINELYQDIDIDEGHQIQIDKNTIDGYNDLFKTLVDSIYQHLPEKPNDDSNNNDGQNLGPIAVSQSNKIYEDFQDAVQELMQNFTTILDKDFILGQGNEDGPDIYNVNSIVLDLINDYEKYLIMSYNRFEGVFKNQSLYEDYISDHLPILGTFLVGFRQGDGQSQETNLGKVSQSARAKIPKLRKASKKSDQKIKLGTKKSGDTMMYRVKNQNTKEGKSKSQESKKNTKNKALGRKPKSN